MKRRKGISMIGLIMAVVLLTAACSKSAGDQANSMNSVAANDFAVTFNADTASEENADSGVAVQATSSKPEADGSGLGTTPIANSEAVKVQSQDKIIRTFSLEVETQTFDSLITQINSDISRLEGYVENSQVSGKRYYNDYETRYGSITARIPNDKVDEFVNSVGKNANVVNKQESTENVSLEYIDTESRIETLKIEQERLYAILNQESSLENIITLESRLSDIRYDLQNYESQIRYYDNKVAYSTVTLSIQEVEKLTQVTEQKQTVGTRIKNGFSNTIYTLSETIKNFIVWFVANLPYLLIWGIIIAVAAILLRKYWKKKGSKED